MNRALIGHSFYNLDEFRNAIEGMAPGWSAPATQEEIAQSWSWSSPADISAADTTPFSTNSVLMACSHFS